MAQIQDPVLGGSLAVEVTARAARVIPVYADGSPVNPKKDGNYLARLDILPSTLVATTVYFAMRNNGTKKVVLERILAALNFAGTAAASRSVYELIRFSGANATGGTGITAVKGDNVSDANTVVSDIRFAPAGLTTAGITFEPHPLALLSHANQLTADTIIEINTEDEIVLNAGEGLAIRANSAIVLGSGLQGYVKWSERA